MSDNLLKVPKEESTEVDGNDIQLELGISEARQKSNSAVGPRSENIRAFLKESAMAEAEEQEEEMPKQRSVSK